MTTNGWATNWTCYCGNFVKDAYSCDECGLTVIGAGVKIRASISLDGEDPLDKAIRKQINNIKNMNWSIEDEDEIP